MGLRLFSSDWMKNLACFYFLLTDCEGRTGETAYWNFFWKSLLHSHKDYYCLLY